MRVALLMAGYLRNYHKNLHFVKKNILEKYDNVDVYLHITNNENNDDRYLNQIDEKDGVKVIDLLKPIVVLKENNYHFSDDQKINNTLNTWFKFFKLNDLKIKNEQFQDFEYDLVIKLRPDVDIKDEGFLNFFNENHIVIPYDSKIDKNKLTNSDDGFVSDAIAYGGSKQMDSYFNIFKNLKNKIISHGSVSETLLFQHLSENNIKYTLENIPFDFVLSKCNVFAICGDSGSGKTTLSDLIKKLYKGSFKLECDRYHKWERNDSNWDEYTHLNPNANYITKMNRDIFNLKLGNDIFQVDYDHHSGKFTEKQKINPSNNLIVCGLHSLYDEKLDENKLYNLRIYMDTQYELKKLWKIKRDVIERGYSINKVLENIEKRQDDFIRYIEPQKNFADIVIRFFSDNKIDLKKIDQDYSVKLNIKFNKNLDISKTLNILNKNSISFDLQKNRTDNSVSVTFNEFKSLSDRFLHNDIITNSYYDYILLFLINL